MTQPDQGLASPARRTPIVDAQVHICSPGSVQQPWPPGSNSFLHRDVPTSADQLLEQMSSANVDRAVIVPSTWEEHGNTLALAAAREHPEIFTVVDRIDLSKPTWPATLAAWPQHGLSGCRLVFARPHELERLRDGTADAFLAEAEQKCIPVMIYVWGAVEIAATFAKRYPDLRLVLDHMCLPATMTIDQAGEIIDEMLALAKWTNVAVKATALPCNATDAYPYTSVHEPLYRVIDAFGANRVFWGTDLTRLPCTYAQAVTMFTEELDGLSSSELDLIMGRGLIDWLDWK